MIIPQTEIVATLGNEELFRATLPPGEYVIGREVGMAIRLHSDKVSRRHALLTLNYFDWLIEDFASANGTFVGGQPVTKEAFIFPQQEVRVGNVRLHLRRLPLDPAGSLAPQTAAVLRYLPAELRGERKYRIHGVIAHGGMGAVLEAEDMATRRRVAMKVLLDARSAEDVARFVEEAQITAQLEHPNIVPLYELNVNEMDRPFYVMKLVRGESLVSALTGLRLERPAALERYALHRLLGILLRVGDALAFAHSKGVVHRDLKPDNVMLGEFGETLVMDWGLAKPLGQCAPAETRVGSLRTTVSSLRKGGTTFGTEEGLALGTPQYMSPEQAAGNSHTVDARTDIYGLGAILYAMLTLRPPVEGANVQEILNNVVAGRITPPAEAVRAQPPKHLPHGKLPPELAAIAMKALAPDPAARYATVRELQAALRYGQPGGGRFGLDALLGGHGSKNHP